ncbi:MAG: hypothetical protein KDC74_05050 [Flavobacteriaceae bacterium]|jgi:hypothetical protein|nr:hypothetical protein [Flavobacteriaceae bacterium]
MKYIILLLSIFYVNILIGQKEHKSSIEMSFGWAKHGTGDISGVLYGFQYHQSFGKNIYWVAGLEGTLHHDPNGDMLFFEYEGVTFDSTIRFVTSGIQLVGGIKYNFAEGNKHTFGIYLLPFLRYQVTSINNNILTEYPASTGLPFPVRVIWNNEPSKTISPGGAVRLNYKYQFNKGFYFGTIAGIQTDTNGDTMVEAGLTFGKSFSW